MSVLHKIMKKICLTSYNDKDFNTASKFIALEVKLN